MTRRETLFALTGLLVGGASVYGSIHLLSARPDTTPRRDVVGSVAPDDGGHDGDAGVDPAMAANASLVANLQYCTQTLGRLIDDESRVERELEAERMTEADASQSLLARRRARRDPSPSDWKQLASTGTIRYLLPCASFNPTPEVVDGLGLAPRDVPAIQSAFSAARAAAWAQIRPLCAAAAGNEATADRLGLDSCPQIVLDGARATDPAAADGAMRAVGAVKAGMADPSTISPEDAVGTAFLALTGVAEDAESRLASLLGPEDAHAVVFGNNGCSHASEFRSPAAASAR